MYLTYPDYISYGGALDEKTFLKYLFSAEAYLNYMTFSRLKNDEVIPEEVKLCLFTIISLMDIRNTALSGKNADGTANIRSQENDGVATTFNTMDASVLLDSCKKEIRQAIKEYLDGVKNEAGQKLLYRGLYEGE